MALQQGWATDALQFKVNNDIRGLIHSVNDASTSAFMWEWFTTKPFVDAGQARFVRRDVLSFFPSANTPKFCYCCLPPHGNRATRRGRDVATG